MSAIIVSARPTVVPFPRPAAARSAARGGAPRLVAVPDPAVPVPAVPVPRAPVPTASVAAPLRLTRRGRLVVASLALLLVGGGGLLGSRAAADGPVSAPVVERHVVTSGETLWSIAASVARPGQDVRDVVVELKQLNHMSDAGLAAGEEIVVPVAG